MREMVRWSPSFSTLLDSSSFRISERATLYVEKWCELMQVGGFIACDVQDLPTLDGQSVGDERTMTTPGNGLRAHNGDRALQRLALQFVQGVLERLGSHVIRVAAKRVVTPSAVDRIFVRVAQPTQRTKMSILDPGLFQRDSQLIHSKLGIMP